MDETNIWKKWVGRRVYVILENGRKYSGVIKLVSNDGNSNFITLDDKNNLEICFPSSEIAVIQHEN